MLEINHIHNGDSAILIKELNDASLDLICTSPDYAKTVNYGKDVQLYCQNTYADWFIPIIKDFYSKLKPTGSFILNINDKIENKERSIYVFDLVCRIVRETNFKLYDRYIWGKKSALPMTGNNRLNDRIEYIFHFVKDTINFKCYTDRVRVPYKPISLRRFKNKVHGNDIIKTDGTTELSHRDFSTPHPLGAKPITIFNFNTGSALRGLQHPAPFHPDLPEFFIKWLTDENDIILDPFAGSGTTGIVAHKMFRNFILFDLNTKYCYDMQSRFANETNLDVPVNHLIYV